MASDLNEAARDTLAFVTSRVGGDYTRTVERIAPEYAVDPQWRVTYETTKAGIKSFGTAEKVVVVTDGEGEVKKMTSKVEGIRGSHKGDTLYTEWNDGMNTFRMARYDTNAWGIHDVTTLVEYRGLSDPREGEVLRIRVRKENEKDDTGILTQGNAPHKYVECSWAYKAGYDGGLQLLDDTMRLAVGDVVEPVPGNFADVAPWGLPFAKDKFVYGSARDALTRAADRSARAVKGIGPLRAKDVLEYTWKKEHGEKKFVAAREPKRQLRDGSLICGGLEFPLSMELNAVIPIQRDHPGYARAHHYGDFRLQIQSSVQPNVFSNRDQEKKPIDEKPLATIANRALLRLLR